jgi:hypothetical protein
MIESQQLAIYCTVNELLGMERSYFYETFLARSGPSYGVHITKALDYMQEI